VSSRASSSAFSSSRSAKRIIVCLRLAPAKRKQTMIRFADLLLENAEELALLETLDMGKPISDSLPIDVATAASSLRWSAEA
ncbi:aldehyde dehydrogenase family protein, partial [Pseudomonas aeruginosa]